MTADLGDRPTALHYDLHTGGAALFPRLTRGESEQAHPTDISGNDSAAATSAPDPRYHDPADIARARGGL